MQCPKVTVIIPNYNHERYLPLRIESVLGQTYQDFELLLLDDCSPDGSRAVLEAYAARDPRIRLVFNEQNSGSTFKQWNKGIALARGEYVWLAESDDYAAPELLTRAVQKFETDPTIGLVYTGSQAVDEQGRALPLLDNFYDDLDADLWKQDFVRDGRELVTTFMSYRNIIPNASAVVIRRDTLLRVGEADETFKLNGDWVFWAAILAQVRVAFIADKLNYFRFHLNNVRSKTHKNGVAIREMARVVRAMEQHGVANQIFLAKSRNFLFKMWLEGIADTSISWQQHRAIYTNLKQIVPGFHGHFAWKFIRFMAGNSFGELRRFLSNSSALKSLRKR